MHTITGIFEKEIMFLFDDVKDDIVHLNAFLKRELKNDKGFLLENMKRFDNAGITYESTKWLRKMKAHKAPNNELLTDFYVSLTQLEQKDREIVEREMSALITDDIKNLANEFLNLFENKSDWLEGNKVFEWIVSKVAIEELKETYLGYIQKRKNGEFTNLEELSNNEFKKLHKIAVLKNNLSDFEKAIFEKTVREAILEIDKPTDKQFRFLKEKLREQGYKLVNENEPINQEVAGKLFAWCNKGRYDDEVQKYIEEINEEDMERILYESPKIKATLIVEAVKEHFAHVPKFKFSTRKHKEMVEKFKAKEDTTLAEVRESDFGEYLVYSPKWMDFVKDELEKEINASMD